MRKGITLIEIIVAVAILAIVTVAGIVAFNPVGQLAGARNQQRQLHLTALLGAIRQNISDSSDGSFTCTSGPLPTSTAKMASGSYNIAPCLVPTYLPTMPFDPSTSTARYVSNTDYDTGYTIVRNASTTQITIAAPAAELGKTISLTR